MFCSGRCAPQMAVGRAGGGDVANVGRSRTDGRTSSVCPSVRLSIYRGRRAERVVARGEPSLAREVALTRPPIISVGKCRCGTLHSRRRGKRRSGSLAPRRRRRRRSCSRRGKEGRREWLLAGCLGCLSRCSVCLFPSLPHRTARRMQQHIYQNPNIISTPLRSCDDDERQTDGRTCSAHAHNVGNVHDPAE